MYNIGNYHISSKHTYVKKLTQNKYAKSPNIILLLLINGACSIKEESSKRYTNISKNYSILGATQYSEEELQALIERLNKDLDSSIYSNKKFYDSLLVEFCACLLALEKKQGIHTLVHTYRILERIAYPLPLLYVRNTQDFKKSFEIFKQYFSQTEKQDGEINFLRQTLSTLLDINEQSFLFEFQLEDHEYKSFQTILQLSNAPSHEENIRQFNLTIFDSINFLVNIRNRFFHALSGKPHFTLIDLRTPDDTFLKLADNFINMLGFLTAKIIEEAISKHASSES